MDPAESRPCLFCGDRTGPKTDEHVVQRTFGTRLFLKNEVCSNCNTVEFSKHDKVFSDFVKMLHGPQRSGIAPMPFVDGNLGICYDDAFSVWTTIYRSGPTYITPPQIVRKAPRRWVGVATNPAALETMRIELSSVRNLSISSDLVLGQAPPFQTSVIRSSRRKYLVRGSDQAEVDRTIALLRKNAFAPRLSKKADLRTVELFPEFRARAPYRSVVRSLAKNTVNFICEAFGSDVSRGSALDDIKAIARGRRDGFSDGTVALVALTPARAPHLIDLIVGRIGTHAIMTLPIGRSTTHIPVVHWLFRKPIGTVFVPRATLPASAFALLRFDEGGVHRMYRTPRDSDWFRSLFRRRA